MNQMESERQRILAAYRGRVKDDFFNLEDFAHVRRFNNRNEILMRMLSCLGVRTLGGKELLDLGCGDGQMYPTWLALGVSHERIKGIDVRSDAVGRANEKFPWVKTEVQLPGELNFPDNTFDVVALYTVFSSILSDDHRERLATGVFRIAKPGALVVIYDLVIRSAKNRNIRAFRLPEIRSRFSGGTILSRRVTFPPPIARKIPDGLLSVVEPPLEALRIFNTHRLTIVQLPFLT